MPESPIMSMNYILENESVVLVVKEGTIAKVDAKNGEVNDSLTTLILDK